MSMQFTPRAVPAQIPLLTNSATGITVGVFVGRHRFRPQAEAMNAASKSCLSPSARGHATRLRAEYDRTLSVKTSSTGAKQ